jgi:hypothetical protein
MIRRRGGVRRIPGARMSELRVDSRCANTPFHPDFLGWVIQPPPLHPTTFKPPLGRLVFESPKSGAGAPE